MTGIKEQDITLKEYNYQPEKIEKGYTNKTLYINLSENKIEGKKVSEIIKEKFIGGRGLGLWYLWNAVTPDTKWDDPENEVIISPGPVSGITQYPGSGKSTVLSISPMTEMPYDSNVGGYFGPFLKFSGWDALEIQGKADKDVIIYIDGNKGLVEIVETNEDATDAHILGELLTEKYATSEEDKRNVAVIAAGSAAEHSFMGLLNFTFYDTRRKTARLKQAGRGGMGRVFRDKKNKSDSSKV